MRTTGYLPPRPTSNANTAMAAANITNEIIITAMDRFVWFVLLVVMSHLVTEFTRVTGYARGNRHDVILINDTLTQPMPVANMIFYPGQEYGLYESAGAYYTGGNSNSNNNNNHNNNLQSNSPVVAGPANGESNSVLGFSFRPLIDSIFEIPISTLRAVNNLVARLTGSYQHQTPTGPLKSVDAVEMMRSLQNPPSDADDAYPSRDSSTMTGASAATATTQGRTLTVRKSLLPEVSA